MSLFDSHESPRAPFSPAASINAGIDGVDVRRAMIPRLYLPIAPLKVLTRMSASSRTFGCTSSCRSTCILFSAASDREDGSRHSLTCRKRFPRHADCFRHIRVTSRPCHLETWQMVYCHWFSRYISGCESFLCRWSAAVPPILLYMFFQPRQFDSDR